MNEIEDGVVEANHGAPDDGGMVDGDGEPVCGMVGDEIVDTDELEPCWNV